MNESGIGAAVKRTEDFRFLTGGGVYTDDIKLAHQSYAYMLRSPHSHARILSIDTDTARTADGVIAVFTGDDMQVGSLPCGWLVTSKDGQPMKEPPHMPLAHDKVRHVGDQVAVVIAESLAQAKSAAESIEVAYEPLAAVADTKTAAEAKVSVHDEAPDNVCYDWEIGDQAAVEDAFSKAAHVSSIDLVNNRLIPNAMEPRAAAGEYHAATSNYTLYTTSQNPHLIRQMMCALVLGIPEHKVRVCAPDVGGGFGSKIFHYAEEAIVTWAAEKVRRPVKWTAERSESFLTDAHGRDHVTHAELAMDADGHFLALRVNTIANLGAYLSTVGPAIPTYLSATLLAGVYRTPAVYCNVKGVFTNTTPVDAYRGAGRPEAAYLLERLVDIAARDMNLDRIEIRRRNFIQPDQFPYQSPVGPKYDSGDYPAYLNAALGNAEYDTFESRREDAKRRGKLRGIGVSSYVEACGVAPSALSGALGSRGAGWESAEIRVHPTGRVTVLTGAHSHGQGHETTFAQLVTDRLGIPFEDIDVCHGDTDKTPFGLGTYGSRSLAVGGVAIMKALDKIVVKSKKIAAHLLEAAEMDIEFEGGNLKVVGTDRMVSFAQIAGEAYAPFNYPLEELEPGLDEQAFYDPVNFSYPAGCQVCEVEIDPETGSVDVVRFSAVDDFGIIINPMIVEGQVHGGLAQGIGQALLERCVYDAEGQLITGSYMDYCMPRADDLLSFDLDTHNIPAPDVERSARSVPRPP
jgi:carbon-monoxide dehydrogenase large subunit